MVQPVGSCQPAALSLRGRHALEVIALSAWCVIDLSIRALVVCRAADPGGGVALKGRRREASAVELRDQVSCPAWRARQPRRLVFEQLV
jgi:hypothetical protein